MMDSHLKISKINPQVYARIGGFLYLVIILAGILGEVFIRSKLFVAGDAAATAKNIMASEVLWRIGIAGDLVMHICDMPLMLIFYLLLRPVNKHLALLAILFNLVQTAVLVSNKLNLLSALFFLGNAQYLKVFKPEQLQVLSYLPIKLHSYGFGVGLMFFGFVCLVEGYLIYRSVYLPRFLGVLMQIAGVCYLVNSFALIVAPSLADSLFPFILLPPFIAELSLCLWFLVKGVNMPEWERRQLLLRNEKY